MRPKIPVVEEAPTVEECPTNEACIKKDKNEKYREMRLLGEYIKSLLTILTGQILQDHLDEMK